MVKRIEKSCNSSLHSVITTYLVAAIRKRENHIQQYYITVTVA